MNVATGKVSETSGELAGIPRTIGCGTPGAAPVGSSSEPHQRASVVGLRSSVVFF